MTLPTPIVVNGAGNGNAKLMIVGDFPDQDSEAEGEPFVGAKGKFTRELLESAGMTWGEVYRSNIERVRPPDNKLKNLVLYGKKPFDDLVLLHQEIKAIQPNVILALGGHALEGLTGKRGITHYRGSILPTLQGYPKVVASIDPANLLRQKGEGALKYNTRWYVKLDFKKAVRESQTKEFNLPQRKLQIVRSAIDLYRFLDSYKHKKRVSIDIEVLKAIPTCVSLAFNKYHAISIPLINPPFFKGEKVPYNELVTIWQMLDKFFETPGLEIIGQNFKFDQQKLELPCLFRLPEPFFDTRVAMHCLYPEFPGSLEFMTSIFTDEPYYKSELKEFDYRYHNPNDLYYYNAKDAAVTYEIFENLIAELEEFGLLEYFFQQKMPLHKLYMDIEAVGFAVNEDERKRIIDKYNALITEAESRFQILTGTSPNIQRSKSKVISVFNSNNELSKILLSMGLPARASYDEESLTALMANNAKTPEQKEVCQITLDHRRYRKTLTTYATAPADYDGRMRTSINYCAAVTGRSGDRKSVV